MVTVGEYNQKMLYVYVRTLHNDMLIKMRVCPHKKLRDLLDFPVAIFFLPSFAMSGRDPCPKQPNQTKLDAELGMVAHVRDRNSPNPPVFIVRLQNSLFLF